MAEQHEQPGEIPNGITVDKKPLPHKGKWAHPEETLYAVLRRLLAMIFFPDPNSSAASTPVLQRIKLSVCENRPQLREASKNTSRSVLLWTRRGSYLRALLVITVGTFPLLTLSGLFIFMLFFLAATVDAIIISLLRSLAAAGGFLALFFACVTAIYLSSCFKIFSFRCLMFIDPHVYYELLMTLSFIIMCCFYDFQWFCMLMFMVI